jgi:uncharacterized protein (DUF4415 family)
MKRNGSRTSKNSDLNLQSFRQSFFLDAVMAPAKRGRFAAIGRLDDGTTFVIFPMLDSEAISVISMRTASRKKGALMIRKYPTRDKFEPGRGYSEEDWNEVSESPEWTEEDFKNSKPFAEVFQDWAASIMRRGRPPAETPNVSTTIRLDAEILEQFRTGGPGWQSRINAPLREWLAEKAHKR